MVAFVEEVEQCARPLGKFETKHAFIRYRRRVTANHMADMQLGQLIVLFAAVELRQNDHVFGLILYVFFLSVNDNHLSEVSVEVTQVLNVRTILPNHAFFPQKTGDESVLWVH